MKQIDQGALCQSEEAVHDRERTEHAASLGLLADKALLLFLVLLVTGLCAYPFVGRLVD